MKCIVFCMAVLGAAVSTSIQRPTQNTPIGTVSSTLPRNQTNGDRRCQLGSIRNKKMCEEHTQSGSLDHRTVLGWGAGEADWSCLPDAVEENHRVCYRTTVYTCGDEDPPQIQCALNRRKSVCGESNEIAQDSTGALFMRSPRYGCVNRRNRLHDYRNREFCIYNVSMPQCTGGLHIRTVQDNMDLYVDAVANCTDYLEFDFSSGNGRDRICGTTIYDKYISASSFYAVFWTDQKNHSSGFELSVTCAGESSSADSHE